MLGVKHEPLSLIPPSFEAPLPPLNPAVFPPTLRELPPPALDQFDLDEHFASPKQRLAQLTNKCTGRDDLDYFVEGAGEVLGVTAMLPDQPGAPKSGKSAKHVLHFLMTELVKFKSINQEGMELRGDGKGAVGDTGMGSMGGGGGVQMFDGSRTLGGMSLAGEDSMGGSSGRGTPPGRSYPPSPKGGGGGSGGGGGGFERMSFDSDRGESKSDKFAHK